VYTLCVAETWAKDETRHDLISAGTNSVKMHLAWNNQQHWGDREYSASIFDVCDLAYGVDLDSIHSQHDPGARTPDCDAKYRRTPTFLWCVTKEGSLRDLYRK
jgi:hypothetical protein